MNTQNKTKICPFLYSEHIYKAILIVTFLILASFSSSLAAVKPDYPVIFVHGLKSDNTTWNDFGTKLVSYLGWLPGGNLVFDVSKKKSVGTETRGDFYTIKFSNNNNLYLNQQGYELQAAISKVKELTGFDKVIIVAHSMGGLASRAYLQGPGYRDDVAKLITIGTPHLGSVLSNILSYLTGGSASAAFHELATNGYNLSILNSTSLPGKVEYRSIVCKTFFCDFGDCVGKADGDGIVTATSQDLGNHPFPPSKHLSIPLVVTPCSSSYLGTASNLYAQIHTCETSNPGVLATIIKEVRETYTDTIVQPSTTMLSAPSQIIPANHGNIDISSSDVELQWSNINSATSYRLMVSENAGDLTSDPYESTCQACIINDTTTANTFTIPATSLRSGLSYYWRVKARSPAQVGYWSAGIRDFVTTIPPQAYLTPPTLESPAGGTLVNSNYPTFNWQVVYGATSYRIFVADDPAKFTTDPTDPLCSGCVINDISSTTNYTPLGGFFNPGETYYWKVKARSPNSYGEWSSPRSFTTPTLSADTTPPSDGTVNAVAGDGQVVLIWDGYSDTGSGIANFKVVYSTTNYPTTCNAGTLLFTGLSGTFTHSFLANGTTVYYRVCAVDGSGNQSTGKIASATPHQALQNGSLRIAILPGAAVIAGAQWKLSGDSFWRDDNETITDLPAGTYKVQFKPITGWSTPVDQTVSVTAGNLNWFNGNPYELTSGGVAPPSNLQVYPNSDGSLSFTWEDNSDNESYFNMYYSISGSSGPFDSLLFAGLSANTTSYSMPSSSFIMGQQYCFRLQAYESATALYSYSNITCGIPNITSIQNAPPLLSAGAAFSIAQKTDGSMWSWGDGTYLQTGYNGTGSRDFPGDMVISDIWKISSGRSFCLAIKPDGRVFTWGSNSQGQLGDGTSGSWALPKQVTGLTGIISVGTGDAHSVAARGNDGTVWTWGDNELGQLGLGTIGNDSLSPVQVPGIDNVVAVSAGAIHTIALKADGTVWAWGYAVQAGDPFGQSQTSPNLIQAYVNNWTVPFNNVKKIAAGWIHSLALKEDGTVWAWGRGDNGELGAPNTCGGSYQAQQVIGLTDIVDIAAGSFSIALKNDGTVWTWGMNNAAQLGRGTFPTSCPQTPVQVPGLEEIVAIAAGKEHGIAMKGDGTLYSWGNDGSGQLGDGAGSSGGPLVNVLDSTGTGMLNLLTSPTSFVRVFPRALSFPVTSIFTTSAPQTVTISNFGNAVSNISGTNISSDFLQSSSCGTTINPGQSCTVNVSFNPIVEGARTGTLTVIHDGDSTSDAVSLSGDGVILYNNVNVTTQFNERGVLIGGGNVQHGYYVTVVAVPNSGFEFTSWSDESGVVSTSPTYSFQSFNDVTLTAVFGIAQHALTVNSAGTGSGTVYGSGTYNYGTIQQISAIAEIGSTFTGWTGECTGLENPLNVLIDEDKTCTAIFTLNHYIVSAIAGQGGSLDVGTPSPQIIDHGFTTQFSFNADQNYYIASIIGCGTNYTNTNISITSKTESTGAIRADCSVNAAFLAHTCYEDNDHDGFGSSVTMPDNGNGICETANGESSINSDCNDGDQEVNPVAIEICDSIDNNCDTRIDENRVCSEGFWNLILPAILNSAH